MHVAPEARATLIPALIAKQLHVSFWYQSEGKIRRRSKSESVVSAEGAFPDTTKI